MSENEDGTVLHPESDFFKIRKFAHFPTQVGLAGGNLLTKVDNPRGLPPEGDQNSFRRNLPSWLLRSAPLTVTSLDKITLRYQDRWGDCAYRQFA